MSETPSAPRYTISDVERDTGLGKDTLRAWERRYGFPSPARDAQGERLYTQATVDRLRLICRLMLAGHRPGRLVRLDDAALRALSHTGGPTEAAAPALADTSSRLARLGGGPDPAFQALLAQDVAALRTVLADGLRQMGLARFTVHRVAPLVRQVGQAWVDGGLGVHQEHLFSETVQNLLRQALYALPPALSTARPRVLLSTLPGETHALGLLMAEVMLALEGCACVSLGVQTPVDAIALAARAHGADIVALSASGCMPERRLLDLAAELRSGLPGGVALWVGGEGSRPRRPADLPWLAFSDLMAIGPAVRQWRQQASPLAG